MLNLRNFTLGVLCLASLSAYAAEPNSGQVFNAPGASIYYEVFGSGNGTPLMVANGGPGFDHTYLHLSSAWEALGKNRRVVFYDQRGNGRSSALKPGQSCTLLDQINDLDALRAHLGFAQIDLLGHSWGGYLVMAYAARHPEHISHLIIVDSAAPKWSDTIFLFKDVFPEGVEREDAARFASQMGDKRADEISLREYLSMLFYSPEKRDAALAEMSEVSENREVNQAINRDIQKFDLNPEIQKFRFPTLVITGRFDMNVAPVCAYRIHKQIPGSQFAVFDKSGHMPFYEEPDKFVAAVDGFLAQGR